MKMNLNEMKTLYTFGCPNREATVERLRYVAALTPDPAAKKLFYMLSVKLSDEKCDKWYRCFYYNLRLQMQEYYQHKAVEYYGAAEPPVRCGESHLSGLTEPPHLFCY